MRQHIRHVRHGVMENIKFFLGMEKEIFLNEGGKGMAPFSYPLVEETAKELYIRALKILPPDVREALRKAYDKETNPTGKETLRPYWKMWRLPIGRTCSSARTQGSPFIWLRSVAGFRWMGPHCLGLKGRGKEGHARASVSGKFHPSGHPVESSDECGEGLPDHLLGIRPENDYLEILMIPKGPALRT